MSWQDELLKAVGGIPVALEQMRAEMAVGLGEFHNGLRLQGARATSVGAGGRTLVSAGAGRLVGWSLRAVAGMVTVNLRDGRDASGDLLATIELADDSADLPTASTQWFGPGGVSFVEGLYVEVEAGSDGTLIGAVYTGAKD